MKKLSSLILVISLLVLTIPCTIKGHQAQSPQAPFCSVDDSAPAKASTTITLQQGSNGYWGCEDTHIAWGGDNFCWQDLLRVGYKQQNAALVRFDLSLIPAHAIVTQATLQLYAVGWSGASGTIDAYCITRTVNFCQANWLQAQAGNPWGQPGCNDTSTDRRASPETSIAINNIRKWYNFNLTTAVQAWVNGSLANNGVLLRAEYSPYSFYFASAQNSASHWRPKLVITYHNPAITSTPTRTATPTETPSETLTHTPTATPTGTPSKTLTPTPTATPTGTPSETLTPTPTATPTGTPSETLTPTPTAVPTQGTITLQQGSNGYWGCEDTHIAWGGDNFCWQDLLRVGYKQQNAALVRFDLSLIPAHAIVTQATLQLYAVGWSGVSGTIDAYCITRTVNFCQANWLQSQAGNPWGQPGCNDTSTDRRASPETSIAINNIRKWYNFNLTTAAQGWVNGSLANNGVLLRARYSPYSFYFASAQNSASHWRPKLVITYRTSNGHTATPTATTTVTTSTPATTTATPTSTGTPTQDILVLGHITDAHIGGSWVYSQRLPVVVSLVSQEVDVMVDTGDCTDHGTAAESIEYMDLVSSNATIPWRAVMGNHDTPGIFEMYIGPLEWSWDVGGYRFIGINTEAINYTALDQSLTTEKPCIIFGHFPLSWCKPVDQSKLRQRFKTYDVPIYVAGHTHGDSLETDPYSATLLLTGGRVGLGHYRVITLRGPEVDSIVFKSAWD